MDVYVLGVGIHPAATAIGDARLEEMAYRTARAALDDAGVRRADIDHLTLAASDELDARGISSMLLAAPSGGYLKDEMRTTDSGLTGLHLGAMRVASGHLHLGLVVSTSQNSVVDLEDIARMRSEPFFLRPVGMNLAIADGLFANAVQQRYGFSEEAVEACLIERIRAARDNPRAVPGDVPQAGDVARSQRIAYPLRAAHRAPVTDGAVALVIASGHWLRSHPEARPLARLAGMAWGVDRYQLDADRLASLDVFRQYAMETLKRADGVGIDDIDVIEFDAQHAWADLAYQTALQPSSRTRLSPSGGAWAQNPYFSMGLLNAAEAALQVSGRAGAHQVDGAKRALAHGASGFAQQAHGFVLMEGVDR